MMIKPYRKLFTHLYIILLLSMLAACVTYDGHLGENTAIPEAQSTEAQLYKNKCSACHSLPHPKRHTLNEWRPLLALMNQRMQEKKNMEPLSDKEKKAILRYLQTHAR